MQRRTLIIAGVLTVTLLFVLVGVVAYLKSRDLAQAQSELAELRAAATKSEANASALSNKLTESQQHVEELEKEKESAQQKHQSLEEEMRAALESRDVTISQLQGKLTVNILDRVLFDSGEAEVKPSGEAVLRKVAAVLAQHPNLKVHVIGHTDNIPIKPAARLRFPSNWELSTARATAAVRFLSEKGGVDPKRLGALGYGEFRPIADNATTEGRARNRRIAITILSEELAGSDVVPTLKTNSPALSVPPLNTTNPPSSGTAPSPATNSNGQP
jgi:chemotaxis protein MotB